MHVRHGTKVLKLELHIFKSYEVRYDSAKGYDYRDSLTKCHLTFITLLEHFARTGASQVLLFDKLRDVILQQDAL